MEGRRIEEIEVRRRDLRFPVPADFADRLRGRTLLSLSRRAKYLVGTFDDDTVLLAHLGMSGRMVIQTAEDLNMPGRFEHGTAAHDAHEHIVFRVGNGTIIRFSDPRRFGMMLLTDKSAYPSHRLIRHLGPEPTGEDFTGPVLAARLKGKKTPIKSALLDQRVVAGVVSHDHDRDGLARRVPVDRASQKSPKVAASRNHPPAVPAVPQLALISLLTHL